MMKPIVLIAPLPKYVTTGQTLGFQSLIQGCKEKGLLINTVDLFSAGAPINAGRFSFRRSLQVLSPIFKSWKEIPFSRGVYLTISCTFLGFIRDFILIWSAYILKKPIILHLKSAGYQEFYPSLSNPMRFIVRKTLSRATKIIALGESIKEQFSFVSNFDQKVVVVHNGPPSVIPGCTNIPKCLRLGSTIHILYLSNLIPSKGFIDVLQSCRILKERGYKNFHFDFCGAFNLSNEAVDKEFLQSPKLFDAWVNQYNLQPYVTYHGTVKGKAKDQILRKANVFILPTRYPTEGQPISIIEAMAYGLPVIATPWKGIVDQVIPGETGYFVKFNSPEQIADKVIEITQDPIHYTDLSHGAITHYQSEFTRERHIDQMTRLFKQVFGPKRMK